jgi:hypothetical protein
VYTKLVIRVLDRDDAHLIGWAEAGGLILGDGMIRVVDAVTVPVDVPGVPLWVSVHWCDMNVETRVALPVSVQLPVEAGHSLQFGLNPAMTIGPAAGGLPPVTVGRRIEIDVPAGQLVQ